MPNFDTEGATLYETRDASVIVIIDFLKCGVALLVVPIKDRFSIVTD